MEAERDANLHQPVAELEQIWDANLPSLHFPLLFQHGELGWHFGVRYQGGTTSYNNNRISCFNLLHTDARSSPVGTHCSSVLQDCFCAQFPHYLPQCVCLVCSCHRAKANWYCYYFQSVIPINIVVINHT